MSDFNSPALWISSFVVVVSIVGGGVSGHLLGKYNETGLCRMALAISLLLGWVAVFFARIA